MPIKKETGKERQFTTGAKKQAAAGKGTPVLVPGDAILDVAKHFEEGAAVHGDRNWEKGIPLSELLNSAERHLQQIKMGLTDESHERAFAWNAIVYLATKLRIAAGILPKELDDMPRYEKTQDEGIQHVICEYEYGWYICRGHDSMNYLHKDLKFHIGTGYSASGCPPYGEAPGCYKTEKLAEETLQAYLDKDRKQCKYVCDDCQHEFDRPIIGEFKQGTDMLLSGCPECGCSSYSIIGDIQYPDLCEHCAEKCRNASLGETVELCRECAERKV